jgi:hypothetical protein
MEINHTYILKKILCYFWEISVINFKFIFYENNSQFTIHNSQLSLVNEGNLETFRVRWRGASVFRNLMLICFCFLLSIYASAQTRVIMNAPNYLVWDGTNYVKKSLPANNSYDGVSPANFSQNAITDINGDLVLFTVDYSIYNKDGITLGEFIAPYNSGLNFFSAPNNGIDEVLIIPVPNECNVYYLVTTGLGPNNPYTNTSCGNEATACYMIIDMNQETSPGSQLYGKILTNSTTNPGANMIKLQSTFTSGLHQRNIHYALSPLLRSADQLTTYYYLFVGSFDNLTCYKVDENGFALVSSFGYTPGNSMEAPETNFYRNEMEVVKYNNEFRVALTYEVAPTSSLPRREKLAVFPVNSLGQIGYPIYQNNVNSNVVNGYYNGPISGLEFSSNGRYLYLTQTTSPYVSYVDLNTNTTVSLNTIIPNAQNFGNSQIEAISGDKILFPTTTSGNLGTLNNVNNPSTLSWSSTTFTGFSFINSLGAGCNGNSQQEPYEPLVLLNDNIDYYDHIQTVQESNVCCQDLDKWDVRNYEVTTNQTWNASTNPFLVTGNKIRIKDVITVKAGKTLTLENMKLEFGLYGQIIVEPTAKLF